MTINLTRTPRGTVITRTNECKNPSFETDTNNWVYNWFGLGGNGTNDRLTGQSWAAAGTALMHKKWTVAPSANDAAGFSYQGFPWTAGVTKTVSGFMLTPGTRQNMAVVVDFFNSAGQGILTVAGAAVYSQVNTWQRLASTVTAPLGAVTANVSFVLMGSDTPMPPGSDLFLDAVLFETSPTLGPYFDGSTGNGLVSGDFCTWTGTAHASTTTYSIPDPAAAIVPVQLAAGYDDSQASRSLVHQLASGAVVAMILPASTRTGILRLFFLDAASSDAARDGLGRAGVWVYRDSDNPAEGMSFVVTGAVRRYQTESRKRWIVEAPYQEVS